MNTLETCDWIIGILKRDKKFEPVNIVRKEKTVNVTVEELNHCIDIILDEPLQLIEKNFQGFWVLTKSGEEFEGFVKRSERLALESSRERSSKTETKRLARLSMVVTIINISWAIGYGIYNKYSENNEIKVLNEKLELQDKKIDSLIDLSWRPSEKYVTDSVVQDIKKNGK